MGKASAFTCKGSVPEQVEKEKVLTDVYLESKW